MVFAVLVRAHPSRARAQVKEREKRPEVFQTPTHAHGELERVQGAGCISIGGLVRLGGLSWGFGIGALVGISRFPVLAVSSQQPVLAEHTLMLAHEVADMAPPGHPRPESTAPRRWRNGNRKQFLGIKSTTENIQCRGIDIQSFFHQTPYNL